MTLRQQLFGAISLLFFAIVIGLMVAGVSGTRNYLEQQLGSHAQDAASSLAHPLSQSLGKGDAALAKTQVSTLFDRGYFQRIMVIAIDGSIVVSKELPPKIDQVPQWFSDFLPLQAPAGEAFISSGWRQLGKVVIISQPTHAYQHLWMSCLETAGWMAAAYVLALFLTHILLRVILNPLSEIERSALNIQEKRFGQIKIVPWALELARVVLAMNNMSRKIAVILDAESARAEGFRKEAYEDGVTGLDNRRSFDIRFKQLLEGDVQFSEGALIGLEVNNLKAFNTESSYKKGDDFLSAVANVATEVLGPRAAILCRMGGGAFGFVLVGIEESALAKLSHDLQSRLQQAFPPAEAGVDISFSLGVVHFLHGDQRSQIMARLDLAIESARQSGRNALQYVLGDGGNTGAIGSMAWRELIQNALEEKRWTLVGQPVVSLTTGKVIHQEIMTRLVGIDGNLVPASTFLPMALRHRLMADIDRALLSLVFGILETRDSSQTRYLAVNMSNQSLESSDFVRWLSGKLTRLGKAGLHLSFELAEYGCSIDLESTRRFASMIRRHHARFGIDNFGLAPNSLQLLRELPPDYIKLNAGLIAEAPVNDGARSLLKSIVALAHSLEIEVIAQGVETAEQVDMLIQDQVGGGQGYHFGAPSADGVA